ncbi:MAG: hypothetical protein JSV88_18365 [Candidatus Aminicenantes bacterium]|nr:MAG: hypothetical protein JSV88_18365 [Candidatus Aminicenantes bacterium]
MMRSKKSCTGIYVYFMFFIVIFLVMPAAVQAGKLIVNVSIDPPTVSVGQPTEIRVEVFSGPGAPLAGAHVEISAGGGVFLDSGSTIVEGHTAADGMFATPWKCDQCASAYVFNIEVNKPGFQGWKGEATVHIAPQPPPGQGSQIFATASADPPAVSRAHPTVIRVEAFSSQGNPIPGAHVKISAGGGFFLDSNTTIVEGQTGDNGVFETPWKCLQCAPAYVLNIEVNKPGFQGWRGETKVEITNQPFPVQGGPIHVNAGTHPPTVSKGQPTEIRVEALSDRGDPIPGAHVKISAGGGIFLHSKGLVMEGHTDANGMFAAPWKCMQCAPAYVFDIEVTKPGFEKGKAGVKVNIKL